MQNADELCLQGAVLRLRGRRAQCLWAQLACIPVPGKEGRASLALGKRSCREAGA